jgi:arginyl-tRNA synthetase
LHGESFYRDKVERVYKELLETGIAEKDEGALVVFHREHPRFIKFPFIIQKGDGASNYGSTDLATALDHVERHHATEAIYVTDGRQQDHFEQLFLTVQKWFKKKNYPALDLRHVWFGTILGEDGKAIKTRSGDPIRLLELVDEAIHRAFALVSEKNPDMPEAQRREVARVVGIGALRYADLAQNRTSDYFFSWEKMLSFEGNTAPYLLYAIARIHSIFRKLEIEPGEQEENPADFSNPEEIALARKLILFPIALDQALLEFRPHVLCLYLYELAGLFSSFYTAHKVMVEEAPIRAKRILLCARTLLILETGLSLLGLETLEQM